MKRVFICVTVFFLVASVNAQKKFSVLGGADILKLLPDQVSGKDAKKDKDKIKKEEGILGVIVHRFYGDLKQSVDLQIINLSPSLPGVNKFITANKIKDQSQYLIVTISGYKGLIQTVRNETNKLNYELLLPMSATLLSIKSIGYSRTELISIANTIPIDRIAKMVAK